MIFCSKVSALSKEKLYIHRDISWLSFNYRVLQEAEDPRNPLLERIKFLAIYSSNLGEFFQVRVANHKNLLRLGKKTKKKLEENPKEILQEVLKVVNKQQIHFSLIYKKLIAPELKKNNIHVFRSKHLKDSDKEFVNDFFQENLLPYCQPILLWDKKVKPFLNNGSLYLAVHMELKGKKGETHFALAQVPTDNVDRFITLPSSDKKNHNIILLDDIIRISVRDIFPGFEVLDTYSIKITRDAELYIDDEFEGDLLEKVKKSLKQRNIGPASRMVYDRKMPKRLLNYLMNTFELEKIDLLPEGRYHNNFDFFKFPSFGKTELKIKDLPSLPLKSIENAKSIFETIEKKDRFLHVPYHSYESVIRLFEEAADDPYVEEIKIVQYRVAKKSRIMDALIKAASNGIKVTAFIEIKARFDEEANLKWGEKLENAGIKVIYSMPGLKVHAKVTLITRKRNKSVKKYAFLSTGNFHEVTAAVYSDMGIFTYDTRITTELEKIFEFLSTRQLKNPRFDHLLVGKFGLKDNLIKLVKQEIAKGKKGFMILKMNSLQDKDMINLLYEASKAGVVIKLIVRGICCIVPGVSGLSENIHAISIVDRFLEHSRVFIFGKGKEEKIYLSSADWMERNLHHRVECIFPIYDKDIQKMIRDVINMQLNDNQKARLLNFKKMNTYQTDDKKALRSQLDTYDYIKKAEKA